MKKSFALLAVVLLPLTVIAQSSSDGEEEAVILSPFLVSTDRDASYSAVSSLSGSRLASPVVDIAVPPPEVPISVVKKADAVVIQFVLSNSADKQEIRNQELYSSVRGIQTAVQKVPGLRMEQREVRFASGNRKMLSFGKGAQTSYANIVIFADIDPALRLADRTKQVRDLLDQIKFPAQIKLVDGSVGLYLKNSSSYRREILQKIFEDLEFLKKGLGPEVEILPSGLNQAVRLRACSETEVELWIDYSFTTYSVRALTNPKK
ncbi:MAG TPA: hypothetical protein VIM71_07435 [Lacunisphaera sp.]